MNPVFGLGKVVIDQLEKRMNKAYLTVGRTFRTRSIAVLASRCWEYMIYAAAIVALRPVIYESQRNVGTDYMRRNSLAPA